MEELMLYVLLPMLVVGLLVAEGCMNHNERMECMKARGEWVKAEGAHAACKFQAQPAQPAK